MTGPSTRRAHHTQWKIDLLTHSPLKNLAGLQVIGDYTSLRDLHWVLHDVNERCPVIQDKDGPLMHLAYEARSAYQLGRDILAPPSASPEIGKRYGFKIVWPVILFQHRALRTALGYIDSGPRHQAVAYALEHILTEGLRDAFKGRADDVIERWQGLDPIRPEALRRYNSRGALFCSWSRTERLRLLPELLYSFHPSYEDRVFRKRGETPPIPWSDFAKWDTQEWPDPF